MPTQFIGTLPEYNPVGNAINAVTAAYANFKQITEERKEKDDKMVDEALSMYYNAPPELRAQMEQSPKWQELLGKAQKHGKWGAMVTTNEDGSYALAKPAERKKFLQVVPDTNLAMYETEGGEIIVQEVKDLKPGAKPFGVAQELNDAGELEERTLFGYVDYKTGQFVRTGHLTMSKIPKKFIGETFDKDGQRYLEFADPADPTKIERIKAEGVSPEMYVQMKQMEIKEKEITNWIVTTDAQGNEIIQGTNSVGDIKMTLKAGQVPLAMWQVMEGMAHDERMEELRHKHSLATLAEQNRLNLDTQMKILDAQHQDNKELLGMEIAAGKYSGGGNKGPDVSTPDGLLAVLSNGITEILMDESVEKSPQAWMSFFTSTVASLQTHPNVKGNRAMAVTMAMQMFSSHGLFEKYPELYQMLSSKYGKEFKAAGIGGGEGETPPPSGGTEKKGTYIVGLSEAWAGIKTAFKAAGDAMTGKISDDTLKSALGNPKQLKFYTQDTNSREWQQMSNYLMRDTSYFQLMDKTPALRDSVKKNYPAIYSLYKQWKATSGTQTSSLSTALNNVG